MTRFFILSSLLVTLSLTTLTASAQLTALQNSLSDEAAAVLEEARAVTEEALATYETYRPDRPLFREAIRLGRKAVNLAPENPETLRFLAELYSVTGFYGPAFGIWQRFVNAGGELGAAGRRQVAQSGTRVGYARYLQGDLGGALSAYRTVTRLEPRDVLAQRWTGRILLEQDRAQAALPFWRRVQELRPGDAGARYFLTLSEAVAEHGLGAARAFYAAVSDYEAGRREQAHAKLVRATEFSPDYAEAWGYRGRLAFEAGNFTGAEAFYTRASELSPQNETYRYFLRQARARATE